MAVLEEIQGGRAVPLPTTNAEPFATTLVFTFSTPLLKLNTLAAPFVRTTWSTVTEPPLNVKVAV